MLDAGQDRLGAAHELQLHGAVCDSEFIFCVRVCCYGTGRLGKEEAHDGFSARRGRGVDVLTALALWGVTSLFFFVWA